MKKSMSPTIQIKCGILIQKRDRLLLIKEQNRSNSKYYWNIIKGSFDLQKDKDIFATAKRESWEEARAKIHLKHLVDIFYVCDTYRTLTQFNFVADLIGDSFKLAGQSQQRKYAKGENIVDIKLFSKTDLKKLKKKDFMNERTYISVQNWLKKDFYDLRLIKIITNRAISKKDFPRLLP